MPTPKPKPKKNQSANNKPKPSKQPETPKVEAAPEPITPVEDIEPDAMEAAVIAELVKSGVSYADAKAQVLGGAQAPQPEPEDIEPPVVPQKSKDFSDDQIELFNMLEELDDANEYEVTANLPAYIMDWVIRKTLQEAYARNNPNFGVEDFLILMLKEQRAIDPSKGGAVKAVSSGPRDGFNPNTGGWA